MKKVILIAFMVLTTVISSNVFAFGPAAHYAVMKKVISKLPVDSRIRSAMERYNGIAMTGANGPDLGYGQVRVVLGYAPWADQYHYDKVGSMAFYQMKNALQIGDEEKIAWAAGWITHVAGDLACHGKYVNPEAGVFLDNPNGRSLHKDLERWSEPYSWVYSGLNISDYNSSVLPNLFVINSNVVSCLIQTTQSIYKKSPSNNEVNNWVSLYTSSLSIGIGVYVYTDYNIAVQNLNYGDRRYRLENAFNTAVDDAVSLLLEVESKY